MCRPAVPTLFVFMAVLAGCTGASTDKDPDGEGTEIGDEGQGFPCTETFVAITDPSASIDGFAVSPADAMASTVGAFSSTDTTLELEARADDIQLYDQEPVELEGDVPSDWTEPECEDAVFVGATVELDAPDLYLWTDHGGLTISRDGTTTFSAQATVWENFPVDEDDDEGGTDDGGSSDGSVVELDIAPTTFDYDDMMLVELVVDGTPSAEGWDLTVTLRGDTLPMGEDANVLYVEEVVWTGSVAAD